jgi:hypothetical protein
LKKGRALSVGQCWIKTEQMLVHLCDFVAVGLRGDCFSWFQENVMDNSARIPSNSQQNPPSGGDLVRGNFWFFFGIEPMRRTSAITIYVPFFVI